MYNSASYLHEFYNRIKSSLAKLEKEYEIIFVNDGSPDQSLQVSLQIKELDSAVRVIDLSRNFGHHKAILTGLDCSSGELVFLIDCDLEEPPELLIEFYDVLMKEHQYDVIYGVQDKRDGNWFKRMAGSAFYRLFNKLSGQKIPQNPCTVRLMTRQYVDNLLMFKDKNVFLAGLFEVVGFSQKSVVISKKFKGQSSYNLVRKFALMLDGITSFSARPLMLIVIGGLFIAILSLIYAIYLVIRRLLFQYVVDGWTSLIVSIWFFSGLILISIGIVGVYVSKIYIEAKDRPYSVIRKDYQ